MISQTSFSCSVMPRITFRHAPKCSMWIISFVVVSSTKRQALLSTNGSIDLGCCKILFLVVNLINAVTLTPAVMAPMTPFLPRSSWRHVEPPRDAVHTTKIQRWDWTRHYLPNHFSHQRMFCLQMHLAYNNPSFLLFCDSARSVSLRFSTARINESRDFKNRGWYCAEAGDVRKSNGAARR